MRIGLVRIGLSLGLAACIAGCLESNRPPVDAVRSAISAALTPYGEVLELTVGPGAMATRKGLPDELLVHPFRAAVKLHDQVVWQTPGTMHYEIDGYQIPGKVMRMSELAAPTQKDVLEKGKHTGYGGEVYAKLPAGTTYVCDGQAIYKTAESGFVIDEVVQKRRGTCPAGTLPECYATHAIADPQAVTK